MCDALRVCRRASVRAVFQHDLRERPALLEREFPNTKYSQCLQQLRDMSSLDIVHGLVSMLGGNPVAAEALHRGGILIRRGENGELGFEDPLTTPLKKWT